MRKFSLVEGVIEPNRALVSDMRNHKLTDTQIVAKVKEHFGIARRAD